MATAKTNSRKPPEHAPGETKTYSVTIDGVEHKEESEERITHVVIGRRRLDFYVDVFAPIWTPDEKDERAFRRDQKAAATGLGLTEWGLARAKTLTKGGTIENYLRAKRAWWIAEFKKDIESGQFDFQAFGWADTKWFAEETADHARKDGWTDLQVVKVGSTVWTSSGKPAAGIRCNRRV
jgi:hypothetical protein